MARTRSAEDARALVESYLQRECSPEISRAFRLPLVHEGIAGTPAFEDLLSHPGMRSAISSSGSGMELVRGMTALKGVTVSVSVSLVDKDRNVIAECSWHAGRGISFRAVRAAD